MLGRIYGLLTQKERRRGLWVALSVLTRALLDFAGIAALIPILLAVFGEKTDIRKALLVCLCALVFVLLKNAVSIGLARFQSRFLLDLYRVFSRKMFCNYYHRGLLFLKGKSSVQLGHEVTFVCYMFSLCVLSPIFRIAGEALLLMLMVTALMIWEPMVGVLLCLGFLPMVMFYVWVLKGRLRRYGAEELEARRKQSRTVVEAFRGYTELEISQAFEASLTSFDEGLKVINHSRLRMETMQMFPTCLSEVSIVVGLMLLLLVGEGNLGVVGGVFAVAAYRMIPAVRSILNGWNTLQNASYSIDVVMEGVKEDEKPEEVPEETFSFIRSIEMDDLGFAFPDGGVILKHFSTAIHKGERIGVRGPSGSGKSTLFNLLLGFIPPTSGCIRIDDRVLTLSNRRQWHRLVGYVPQEIFIIQGSLADNIALGRPIVREKIERVLTQVQLKEWASELPEGMDTSLGEYGSRLSGGQKQRIGIARALYKEAEVLFFDEATSALDSQTEQEINAALKDLSENHKELTMIIIAHRESSLTFCDRIIDLEMNGACKKLD
ncbi:MAG: ABC transporter ATP-binding protein [Bacteroidaceae bacterium]|nr:ABC transporter ATP-binding protein [Bacteroidaceae bacterium]